MKKFTMGVLGLGEGRSIISAVQNSELWELGNICDLNEELCKERCQEFGLDGYTTEYQNMLDDESIDVIARSPTVLDTFSLSHPLSLQNPPSRPSARTAPSACGSPYRSPQP